MLRPQDVVPTSHLVTDSTSPCFDRRSLRYHYNRGSQVSKTEGSQQDGRKGQQWEPVEDDDGVTCDTISVTRSELGEEELVKLDAKDALGQAPQEEELHVKDLRGEHSVANRRGLRLAENVGVVEQQFVMTILPQQQIDAIPSLKTKIG